MKPQRERMPNWVASQLDDSMASMEIDAISFYVLMLYGDRRFLAGIVDQFNQREITVIGDRTSNENVRPKMIDQFLAHADELWPRVPDEVRHGLIRAAVLSFLLQIRDAAYWLAEWAVGDMCEGGYAKAYRKPPRPGLWRAWMPGKKMARRLKSPRFIRNYVRRCSDTARRRAMAQRMKRMAQGTKVGTREQEEAFFELLENQDDSTLPVPEYRIRLIQEVYGRTSIRSDRSSRREKKRDRRKLIRAANFAASLIGPKDVNKFIRGDAVVLRGKDLTFAVEKQRSIDAVGHGCLNIAVKATGGPTLGSICFYIDGTPCLDQLAALALHVESGAEREILSVANMITVTTEGVNHPFLQGRANPETIEVDVAPQRPLEIRSRGRVVDYNPDQLREQRREMYWATMGHYWQREVANAIMGRNGLNFQAGFSELEQLVA